MNFSSTDSVASGIGSTNNKASGANSMSADRSKPYQPQFTPTLRIIEILRGVTKGDVKWLTLSHLQILLLALDLETPFGLETQTIHKLSGVEKSTANRIMHSFADSGRTRSGLGYFRFEIDPEDKRIRRLYLTKKGQELKTMLAAAGGKRDDAVDDMLMAHEATLMQSTEKAAEQAAEAIRGADLSLEALQPYKIKKGDHNLLGSSKISKSITATKIAKKRATTTFDRALKDAERGNRDYLRLGGKDVPFLSPEELHAKDTSIYHKIKFAGVWMLFDVDEMLALNDSYLINFHTPNGMDGLAAALSVDDIAPSFIQQNLYSGQPTIDYLNSIIMALNAGDIFSAVMSDAQKFLNEAQYNYIRNRIVHDLADTRTAAMQDNYEKLADHRDSLMRDTDKKSEEIADLENAADEAERRGGTMHRMANLALQRLDGIHDQDDEHVEASIEALDLATDGLDQQAAAVEIENEAQKLRVERDTMEKALNDNAKVMAEMQAMMKQMMEKGD